MLKAGDLRHRIAIFSPTITTDGLGQVLEGSPTLVAKVWAAKWQLSTKDVARQAGETEQAQAKFLIRHRDDLSTKMIVQYRRADFRIIGTEDYEDRVGLFLFVRAIS